MSHLALRWTMVAAWLAVGTATRLPSMRRVDGDAERVARGRYLVEGVAMCGGCHTPVDGSGEPDRGRLLMGAAVRIRPTSGAADWAVVAPRLAGLPPGTDAQFITLMMTGIARTGKPPKAPMPQFRMTREDAEAVLAYLQSLEI
jgi:mono/diheme cytochrome c family protein